MVLKVEVYMLRKVTSPMVLKVEVYILRHSTEVLLLKIVSHVNSDVGFA